MLTKHDYQAALDVQSAVNLSGVVFSFAEIMKRICDEVRAKGQGTYWRNHHPIVRMFTETIAEKSSLSVVSDRFNHYHKAYDFCAKAATGQPARLVLMYRGDELVYEVKGDE